MERTQVNIEMTDVERRQAEWEELMIRKYPNGQLLSNPNPTERPRQPRQWIL